MHGQAEETFIRASSKGDGGDCVRQVQAKPEFCSGYGTGGDQYGMICGTDRLIGFDQLVVDPDLYGLGAVVGTMVQIEDQIAWRFLQQEKHLRVMAVCPGHEGFIPAETGDLVITGSIAFIKIQCGSQGIIPGAMKRIFMKAFGCYLLCHAELYAV